MTDTIFAVVRTDDHGSRILVRTGLELGAAQALADALTARAHKQSYDVLPAHDVKGLPDGRG